MHLSNGPADRQFEQSLARWLLRCHWALPSVLGPLSNQPWPVCPERASAGAACSCSPWLLLLLRARPCLFSWWWQSSEWEWGHRAFLNPWLKASARLCSLKPDTWPARFNKGRSCKVSCRWVWVQGRKKLWSFLQTIIPILKSNWHKRDKICKDLSLTKVIQKHS